MQHPAAGLEQRLWRDGCSWTVLMEADENKIIIKVMAFQSSVLRGDQNDFHKDLLVWIVPGMDLYGTPTVYGMSLDGAG